jgi:hypothetical protein
MTILAATVAMAIALPFAAAAITSPFAATAKQAAPAAKPVTRGPAGAAAKTPPPAVDDEDPKAAEETSIMVLPFTGDEKGLGDKVREMVRTKARRLGAVLVEPPSVPPGTGAGPGSAAVIGATQVSVDSNATALAAWGIGYTKADIVVIGQVLGAGPYTVRLVSVRTDDRQDSGNQDRTYRASKLEALAVEMSRAVYDLLGMLPPADAAKLLRADAAVERRWRDAPNLVTADSFPDAGPKGDAPGSTVTYWTLGALILDKPGTPAPKGTTPPVTWADNPDGSGKVLKFDLPREGAESYGLPFYSDWIRIEPGATYRFSCRYKTLGPALKVFLKGYHPFGPDSPMTPRREVYRRQVHPTGPAGQWNTVTADFVPLAMNPDQAPTYMKVDMFAYLRAGVVYWDEIVLKKVRDAPAAK